MIQSRAGGNGGASFRQELGTDLDRSGDETHENIGLVTAQNETVNITNCLLCALVRTQARVRCDGGIVQVEWKLKHCGFLMLLKPKCLYRYLVIAAFCSIVSEPA